MKGVLAERLANQGGDEDEMLNASLAGGIDQVPVSPQVHGLGVVLPPTPGGVGRGDEFFYPLAGQVERGAIFEVAVNWLCAGCDQCFYRLSAALPEMRLGWCMLAYEEAYILAQLPF